MSEAFSPLPALLGGVLIGLATSILLLFNGRVAGISGIVSGLLAPVRGEIAWRALFVGGLLLGGLVLLVAYPAALSAAPVQSPGLIAVAGLLVGFGTRLGSGCTSGHGVCGLSRLSTRSLVATLTFIGVGMLTVGIGRALSGGGS